MKAIISLLFSVSCLLFAQQPMLIIENEDFNTPYRENMPSVSYDGLELYFHSSSIPGGQGGDDIWYVKRETVNDKWSSPINVGIIVNTVYHESAPCISYNGLSLYFNTDRPGGMGGYDIWFSTRETKDSSWGPPQNIGSAVNTKYYEYGVSISSDELTLYFSDYTGSSPRENGLGLADIWFSRRNSKNDPWGEAINLGPEVNTDSQEVRPLIAPNDLLLLYSSTQKNGLGNRDIWISQRKSINSKWGPPINIGKPINTEANENAICICFITNELYLASDRATGKGDMDIWMFKMNNVMDYINILYN